MDKENLLAERNRLQELIADIDSKLSEKAKIEESELSDKLVDMGFVYVNNGSAYYEKKISYGCCLCVCVEDLFVCVYDKEDFEIMGPKQFRNAQTLLEYITDFKIEKYKITAKFEKVGYILNGLTHSDEYLIEELNDDWPLDFLKNFKVQRFQEK